MLIVPDDISNMRCVVAWHHARQYQQRYWDDLLMLQIGQLNPALPIVFRLVHPTPHQPNTDTHASLLWRFILRTKYKRFSQKCYKISYDTETGHSVILFMMYSF